MIKKTFPYSLYFAVAAMLLTGCKKILEVSPPIDSLTTREIFSNNKQAEWAVAGIYTKMINGIQPRTVTLIADNIYSAGLSTIMGGLSADELRAPADQSSTDLFASQNKLTRVNSKKTAGIWNTAFRTIFDANAVLDGISESTSDQLADSVKKQLRGEALALRALSYFYLVNFFGDLPLPLNSDYSSQLGIARSPVNKVYDQIKADLIEAKSLLRSDFAVSNNERIRVNKWFAEALLARVYLYTKEYQQAINSSSAVINHTALFGVEQDLSQTFLPNNRESIFQLQPSKDYTELSLATPEGFTFNQAAASSTGFSFRYKMSDQLLDAFEPGDQRKQRWKFTDSKGSIPAKYSKGQIEQYYTVMRVSELHLIRAEATVLLTPAAKNDAIEDLNLLRRRAGLDELDNQLSVEQVVNAIAQERRVELFLEWGHRWFDLKRTGKAAEVLSGLSYKQPWWGNYQLLYPIPDEDISRNSNLVQNPEYNSQ